MVKFSNYPCFVFQTVGGFPTDCVQLHSSHLEMNWQQWVLCDIIRKTEYQEICLVFHITAMQMTPSCTRRFRVNLQFLTYLHGCRTTTSNLTLIQQVPCFESIHQHWHDSLSYRDKVPSKRSCAWASSGKSTDATIQTNLIPQWWSDFLSSWRHGRLFWEHLLS